MHPEANVYCVFEDPDEKIDALMTEAKRLDSEEK